MAANEPSGCLGVIFQLFGATPSGTSPATGPLPYRRKDYLLSKAERSFFGVLQQVSGDEYLIFAKIRLADLLWMPKGTENWRSHQNRINPRHIDFVLCDKDTVRPLLAIELDDASHAREDRKSRDDFVDRAVAAAKLPLLRVRAQQAYNVNEIREAIRAQIAE